MNFKNFALALCAVTAMSLASCGGADANKDAKDTTVVTPQEQQAGENAPETKAPVADAPKTETATPAAATQDFGAPEKGEVAIMYAKNEKINPANMPIFIDFNASWCGPCKKFAPRFHNVAKEFDGKAIFLEVDVDKNPITREQFFPGNDHPMIPQLTVLMPDGKTSDKKGLMSEDEFRTLVLEYVK